MQIFEGEMVCLLGGNASGKSTTLKTILGYVTPSQGEVVFEGEIDLAGCRPPRSCGAASRWCRRTAGSSGT